MKETYVLSATEEAFRTEYNIPGENIEKALAVQKYINKIDAIVQIKDQKEALEQLKDELKSGSAKLETSWSRFTNWSIIHDILDYYRREQFLIVVHNLANKCLEENKQDEMLSSYLYYLVQFHFNTEAELLIPRLFEYAQQHNGEQILYGIQKVVRDSKLVPGHKDDDWIKKTRLAQIEIYRKNRNEYRLLTDFLKGNFPDRDIFRAALSAFDEILKTETTKELAKNAQYVSKETIRGESETVSIFSLIELLRRYNLEK